MSRSVIAIPTRGKCDDTRLRAALTPFFAQYGYTEKFMKDGERCWSQGDGVIVKRRNFGIIRRDAEVLLQGWTSDPITGESELEGFINAPQKKKMRKILQEASVELRRIIG